MKKLLFILICLLFSVGISAQQTFTTFQDAQNVIGQPDFNSVTSNCTQAGLSNPFAMAISSQGMVAIAEQGGGKVKIWKSIIAVNQALPDVVVGKTTFTNCVFSSSVTANRTNDCQGVAFSPDGNKLIVSDYLNHRILIWNSIPLTNGQPADVVIGQVSFTQSFPGISNVKLNGPVGLWISPDGKLLAIDQNNHRILIWNTIPTTNGAAADVVLGQTIFSSATSGNALNKFNFPYSLQLTSDGKLLVADTANHRVLIFNSIPTANGTAADLVIGQTGGALSIAGTSSTQFQFPVDFAIAPDGKLAIADFSNNRVLIYNAVPITNGASADLVLGQPNFTTSTSYSPSGFPNAKNIRQPFACEFDTEGRLFVLGYNMNRVLIYGYPSTDVVDLSVAVSTIAGSSCVGNNIAATVTISNNSTDAASGVKVKLNLPSNLQNIIFSPSVGTFDAATFIWDIESVPANAAITQNFTVSSQQTGSFSVDAIISGSFHLDPDTLNNSASTTYTISSIVAGPTGNSNVTRCANATIASLSATGDLIKWYASPSAGTPLADSVVLATGVYYASQTVDGCESSLRLAVNVTVDNSAFCNGTAFTNFQAADYVVGQSTFTTATPFCSVAGLNGTSYVAISSKGVLAVAEQTGGRVKIWNSPYVANGTPADVVIGKPDFTSCSTSNNPTQSRTRNCDGVAFSPDGIKLIISDSGNNRILIWNSIPTTNGQPADVVLGQATFTTNASGISASSFNYPTGIFVAQDGKLFISDFFNNRVLVWNTIPTTNAKAADMVLGQPNFTTNTAGSAASNMNQPWGIWVSPDGKLLVADHLNNRVLVWNSVPTTNGAPANVVIGQTNFNLSLTGTTANTFFRPPGVAVSTDGKLAIGDFNNKRVLIYNSIPTTNGASADAVLGQPDFNSNDSFAPSGTPSANNMNFPYNVAFDLYGRLFVVGRNMHRGMVFGKLPLEQAELGISITSTSNLNCSGNANTVTITLTNNSSFIATGVIAAASFSNQISYVSNTPSTGSFNPTSGQWNIGNLAANSSVTLIINGITGPAGDFIANASILHSNQFDSNMENNAAGITLTVGNPTETVYSGNTSQSFCGNPTIADLSQGNTIVKWFETETGGTPLAPSIVLVNGGIYFATQSPGCDVIPRIAVTVTTIPFPTPITVVDISSCGAYTLPLLSSGNYFTAVGGTGTMLSGGAIISTNQTIYIYYESGTVPNCVNEVSFNVTITSLAVYSGSTSLSFCGNPTIVDLSQGNTLVKWFETETGGTPLAASTVLVNGGIYFATQNPDCTVIPRIAVTVTTIPFPTPITVANIASCDSYTLPLLTSGNYFTAVGGTGTMLLGGAIITTNQTIYIYSESGTVPNCINEMSFNVTINTSCSTASFYFPDSICEGDSGIVYNFTPFQDSGPSGTWSPAVNNMQTTTYTWTPDTGGITYPYIFTLVVNPILDSQFDQVAAICPGDNVFLPSTSNNGISGEWTPDINNLETTTYTFTPYSWMCGTATTMTVVVGSAVPIFDAVPNICSGAVLSPLPTTSNNGIAGSWSPTLNNLETTTYTFTPEEGTCGQMVALTISVSDGIIPTFDAIPAICSGGTLAALPTTSLNGIIGSWLPALNNLETTTYTFMPDDVNCAEMVALTVTVSDGIIPTFDAIPAICSGGTLAALPTVSLNGIIGSWLPDLNNLETTIYTFMPDDVNCAEMVALTVTVSDGIIPTFDAIPAICSGATLVALPTTSLNGIIGSWSPDLNNLETTTYTFMPDDVNCAEMVALTVTVSDGIIPTFDAIPAICSGATLAALPTTSLNGISGSWSPVLNNNVTTTYTFTPDDDCAVATTLTITVNPNVTPTFDAIPAICSGGTLAALPTTSLNGISGSWSPVLNNNVTTTYTFTPNDDCAVATTLTITVNPNVTPTFTAVTPICSGATLAALPTTSLNGISGSWSPILNNLATTTYTFTPNVSQCAATATLTITVNSNVTPTFTAVAPICFGATLSALPATSLNEVSGSWSPVLNNLATTSYTFTPDDDCAVATTLTITVNPNATPTFTAVAPICFGATLSALPATSLNGITGTWSPILNNLATTTYTFTPNVSQCAATATLTITVNSNVTPTFTAVAPICFGATLSALPATSLNGITGTWSPVLNNLATTTYTFIPNVSQCATTATLTITVNPNVIPTFTAITPICSGATLSALPATSLNGISGTWSPILNNLATTTYTFTPNVSQCAATATLTITVSNGIVPAFTAITPICFGATLSALATTSLNGITGSWSPILNNLATTTYTFTPNVGQCAATTTLTITVNNLPATPIVVAPAATCSTNATLTVNNYNAALTYMSSPAGATVGALGAITGAVVGTPYTFTAANATCTSGVSQPVTIVSQVVVGGLPTLSTVTAAPVCIGSTTNIVLSGLIPNQTGIATYKIGNGPLQTQSGTSTANGTFSFATPVLFAQANGLVVEITKISNGTGCETTFTGKTVTLTVTIKPTLNTVTAAPVCIGSATNIVLSGLIPNTTSVATYKIGNGPLQTQSGTSTANGTFSFPTPVLFAQANGLVVTITKISNGLGCETTFTGKTVTLVVTIKPTLGTVTALPACIGSTTNIVLSGLVPNQTGIATYKIGNGPLLTQMGTSSANGTFSFPTPVLSALNHGLVVEITKISNGTNCETTFTGKTVTLIVQNCNLNGLNNPPTKGNQESASSIFNFEGQGVSKITIYPNPTSDVLHINTTVMIKDVAIFNMQGQKVLTSQQKEIAVLQLPAGAYLICIQDSNNNRTNIKFVKK